MMQQELGSLLQEQDAIEAEQWGCVTAAASQHSTPSSLQSSDLQRLELQVCMPGILVTGTCVRLFAEVAYVQLVRSWADYPDVISSLSVALQLLSA